MLNAIGAAIWAVSFGFAGYFFGTLVTTVLKDVKQIEQYILIGVVVVLLVLWLIKRRKRKHEESACMVQDGTADPVDADKPGTDGPRQ